MHILVLPSEEYVPAYSPLAGIFQQHQISVLTEISSYQIGVISINLRISLPMIIKALLFRLLARTVNNDLRSLSIIELVSLARNKLFHIDKYISAETQAGVNIVRVEGLYYFPPSEKTDYISWIKAGLSAFDIYVKKFGLPNVIHAHNTVNAGLLAREIKRKFKVNYLLTEHSSYYHQNLIPQKMYSKIFLAIESASGFTVVSPKLKDSIIDKVGDVASSALCLPNVLPPLYEYQAVEEKTHFKQKSGKFIFLSVGNLLPVKGHEFLIRAFSEFVNLHDDVLLKIVGDGPLRQDLASLVVKLNLNNKVEFLGEVSANAVRAEMLNASVFVFPSRFETFGVALIEAMSCGLPVISTACGGPDLIVNDETGILVEPESIDSMRLGLEWAIEKSSGLDPESIRKSVVDRFGKHQFFEKLNKHYVDIADLNNSNSCVV